MWYKVYNIIFEKWFIVYFSKDVGKQLYIFDLRKYLEWKKIAFTIQYKAIRGYYYCNHKNWFCTRHNSNCTQM